jgi:hypothetical protein
MTPYMLIGAHSERFCGLRFDQRITFSTQDKNLSLLNKAPIGLYRKSIDLIQFMKIKYFI